MKKVYFLAALALPFLAQSLEFEILTENDQIRVSKIKVFPGEEVGWHRDENPRVVIGLKGGTVTRIEEDGSKNDVYFPEGKAIFLDADPIGQMHRGINASKREIEIIVVEVKSPQGANN